MSATVLRFVLRYHLTPRTFEDGTRFTLIWNKYDARRFVAPRDERVIQDLTSKMSSICQEALGTVLSYPIFEGKGYENKAVILVYPKGSKEPCAFSVCFHWKCGDKPIIHSGLFIVSPKHRGHGIQTPMGFVNLALLQFYLNRVYPNKQVWVTDLGNSASGLRAYSHFNKDVYPRPELVLGKTSQETEALIHGRYANHLEIAREFHRRFKRESGMAPDSYFVEQNFVVKGSNGKGGAEVLATTEGGKLSRNKSYNDLIAKTCTDVTDEIIAVGQFDFWDYLRRQLSSRL